MAENMELGESVAIVGIATFVGQNVEEMSEFGQPQFEITLRQLLDVYNERVREVEPDPSLLIEIPSNLGRD